jgi:hypothetical protein
MAGSRKPMRVGPYFRFCKGQSPRLGIRERAIQAFVNEYGIDYGAAAELVDSETITSADAMDLFVRTGRTF